MKSLGKYKTTHLHKSDVEIIDEERGGYHQLVIKDKDDEHCNRTTTVQYRNVGLGNIDNAIQFEVQIVIEGVKRNIRHNFGFSVPHELKEIFLSHLVEARTETK